MSGGIAVGRWRPPVSHDGAAPTGDTKSGSLHKRSCSAVLSSVLLDGGIRHRKGPKPKRSGPPASTPLECAAAKASQGMEADGRNLWGDIFFYFKGLSSLEEPSESSQRRSCGDESESDCEDEAHDSKDGQRVDSFWTGKSSGVLRPYSFVQPSASMAAGAACSGFLLGLQIAAMSGLGRGTPQLIGGLSSLCALGGAASCVFSVQGPGSDSVHLPPWTAVFLSGLCSGLAPIALVPLSPAALAGVAGPIRLALPGAVGVVTMFEITHRRWACIDPSRVAVLGGSSESWLEMEGAKTDNLLERVLRIWWRHFSPSMPSCGVGSVYLLGNLAVTYGAVHIDLSMTQWKNAFFTALQAKNSVGFYHQLYDFAPIALASTMATIYSGYLATMWDLRWREELTGDFVQMWLRRKAYYHVRFTEQGRNGGIDNFDQRLVDDTAIFASSSRGLLCGFAEAFIRLAVFFPNLVRLSPTPMVWQFCIALSLVSSVLTHLVGRPLALQNAQVQRTEADFRSSLIRLRLFAEDIALQHGEGAEGAAAARCFESIKAATWMAARGTLNLVTYTSAYGLAGGILPLLVLVPSYFSGQIDLGTMFQIEALVGGVRSSLDFFIGAYGDIATWKASADRMLALEAVSMDVPMAPTMQPHALEAGAETEESDLYAQDMSIAAAGTENQPLIEHASFQWTSGDRILLTGPSGCGKTALLRTLAGAWPPPSAGSISAWDTKGASAAQTMLLTEKGFLLPLKTTLRKCLAYPEAAALPDEELATSMTDCGVEHLLQMLDVEADWQTDLSSVDRQRLVFARLITRWPVGVKWLLMDDVAAGLPESAAVHLHSRLIASMPTDAGIVVVSRHPEVLRSQGFRHFQIDPLQKTLAEAADKAVVLFALPATGEAPEQSA